MWKFATKFGVIEWRAFIHRPVQVEREGSKPCE
jgi:hypothetical protein